MLLTRFAEFRIDILNRRFRNAIRELVLAASVILRIRSVMHVLKVNDSSSKYSSIELN